MQLSRFAVLIAFCFLFLNPAYAKVESGQEMVLAGRHTVYWAPPDSGSAKQPLILFSHGFKGCSTQSTFLTEALAADGYWVFAPDHDDANCRDGGKRGRRFRRPEHGFGRPDSWDDTTYTDRADDMRDLLDALEKNPQFSDRIDFSRIGLMGHSLGGYTVLGLAGAWPSWKMPSIKAVLALSPYSQPFINKHTMGDVNIPIMFQGGTRDFGITPSVKKEGGGYDQTTAPKYFVEFDGAGHLAWTNMKKDYQPSIIAYSVAFLDHYVKGLSAAPDLTAARSDVWEIKYDSHLGKSDSAASKKN